MPGKQFTGTGKPYLRVVNGSFAHTVDKDTEGARRREWETPDGKSGVKYEIVYINWEGIIRNITFKDGDYGETCTIEFDDANVCLNTASRYFTDFACKLFSADIKKSVLLHPYDMEVDTGRKSGFSFQQDGEKLKNHFYDGEKNLHGFPEVDREKAVSKRYWKIYFAEVTGYLVDKIKELEFENPQVETVKEIFETEIPSADDKFLSDLPF